MFPSKWCYLHVDLYFGVSGMFPTLIVQTSIVALIFMMFVIRSTCPPLFLISVIDMYSTILYVLHKMYNGTLG